MLKSVSFLFLSIGLTISLFASGINVVPVANKNISYKSKIYSYDVRLVQENKKYRCKEYLNVLDLQKNRYFAAHYIAKDRAICANNVYIPERNIIRFKFGNLEIEREGTIVRETDEYIRIKNLDGTIEKIYKDGRH